MPTGQPALVGMEAGPPIAVVKKPQRAAKSSRPARARSEKEKRSWELCALATKEQDPLKLVALMAEINALLEEREKIKHPGRLSAHPPQD